jgi:hypothetical protein
MSWVAQTASAPGDVLLTEMHRSWETVTCDPHQRTSVIVDAQGGSLDERERVWE